MKLIASSRFNWGMLGGLPVLIHGRSVAAAKNIAIRLAEGVPVTHGNAQMPAASGLAIYRLIASAELNDIDPEAYLRFVIGRIADHPVNRLALPLRGKWHARLPFFLRRRLRYYDVRQSREFLVMSTLSMSQQVDSTEHSPSGAEFLVICLCAEWCGTCRDYRAGFEALAASFPTTRFCWLDIEDRADDMGDLDIENFPTLFIQRRESVLFFGTMLPHLNLLHRLIETFHEQSYEESQRYAWASPERVSWQENKDLGRLRQAVAS